MISLFNLVLMASCLAMTHGMKCYIGEETFASQFTQLHCPRPLLDDSANSYCCINTKGDFYCCSLFEFASTYIIIAVVIIVVLSIVCSIICCFCCPCCFFYKRRHAGKLSKFEDFEAPKFLLATAASSGTLSRLTGACLLLFESVIKKRF